MVHIGQVLRVCGRCGLVVQFLVHIRYMVSHSGISGLQVTSYSAHQLGEGRIYHSRVLVIVKKKIESPGKVRG